MAEKINDNETPFNDASTQHGKTPVNDDSTQQQNVVLVPTTSYAKQFPDVTKIEEFDGHNFKRWQERVHSILDMYAVANALTKSMPASTATENVAEQWTHANRVCRCTILSTLSNDLFDVYCSYKEAKDIWESMAAKYTAEDAGKQKFVIGNYYRGEMVEDKDIKAQMNEYHKLLEDLKTENIILSEAFVAGILIEKLPESWKDYKNQLKHKQKQLPLADLITHIIIEETNRKEIKAAKAKSLAARANIVQNRGTNKRHRKRNENPPKAEANLAEAEGDDMIVAVVSQVNMVTDVSKWVVDSGATRHICANKDVFTSYTVVGDGEEQVYLGDSHTVAVQGKGKVMLKLTSGKTLALSDVLHVPNIRTNLISVARLNKVGVKVSFESDKIVMTKNDVFVGKGYCDQGLFVLSLSD
ncbi:hypothetical protein TSUD_394770 [Trifolium subterraneum]|uniref:Retrovirus-related Pol polyprotein from transposon TNT 1-94-like beta-barrel domain-containing protein n=1 Tax=Trifolium subterraneum TaxID=3900 RepID=A0A2Z6NZN6_TRISU|nr:hypothetical protein TSUD_394770 [Trifolium subterraneum]